MLVSVHDGALGLVDVGKVAVAEEQIDLLQRLALCLDVYAPVSSAFDGMRGNGQNRYMTGRNERLKIAKMR